MVAKGCGQCLNFDCSFIAVGLCGHNTGKQAGGFDVAPLRLNDPCMDTCIGSAGWHLRNPLGQHSAVGTKAQGRSSEIGLLSHR